MSSQNQVEVFLMKSKQDAGRLPHWSIMILDPMTADQREGKTNDVLKGKRFHCKGGPTMNTAYKVAVEDQQKFRSVSVQQRQYLGVIKYTGSRADLDKKLSMLANSIVGQQCQKYVVCLLALWASKNHLSASIAQRLAADVSMGSVAAAYEAQPGKYPPEPVGITLPPTWPKPKPASRPSSSHSNTSARSNKSGGGKK